MSEYTREKIESLDGLSQKDLSNHFFELYPSNWRHRLEETSKLGEVLALLESFDIHYPKLKQNLKQYVSRLLD